MQITVELPDDIVQHPDPGRKALEALAIEGYRSEALTHYQASQLLGLTRFEFDGFLKDRNIHDHAYSIEDLEQTWRISKKFARKACSANDPGRGGYGAATLPGRNWLRVLAAVTLHESLDSRHCRQRTAEGASARHRSPVGRTPPFLD